MYESELINKVEEGKEYKREILEEFVSKHHYHLYSKTMGSSTEGHISHVLSARMSSRPMGWSRQGADSLSHKNILEEWRENAGTGTGAERWKQNKTRKKKNILVQAKSCHGKKHRKTNGKYIETLQASVSRQISGKMIFHNAIASVC